MSSASMKLRVVARQVHGLAGLDASLKWRN